MKKFSKQDRHSAWCFTTMSRTDILCNNCEDEELRVEDDVVYCPNCDYRRVLE